ncbi:MAG: iron-containing alcohol dehydrogenase, partial [Abditibacteriales bacterium]|nr:iron-containing alcohol dehydrogenase [Abditibacteriales bacterium]MDW8365434.1 iron-containing alcohol dehydrogenase [Abditibacteriales bacterium]
MKPRSSLSHFVVVQLDNRSYPILIAPRILEQLGAVFEECALPHHVTIVSNQTVAPIYAEAVCQRLNMHGYRATLFTIPDGEEYKSLEWAQRAYDHLLATGADRASLLVGIGGGVVCDLTGFVAATYMRGIQFALVPTTLLAQVDASVGGKVAVNH